MASASDIMLVRGNTNETDTSVLTDPTLSALIDDLGVTGATAHLWSLKVARFVEEVDVSEAGASHKFSDLFVHAKEMALLWSKRLDEEVIVESGAGRVRVKVIDRQ
jgi:hypothetical protein